MNKIGILLVKKTGRMAGCLCVPQIVINNPYSHMLACLKSGRGRKKFPEAFSEKCCSSQILSFMSFS